MRFISQRTCMTRYSMKISYWFIRDIMLVVSGMSEDVSTYIGKGVISYLYPTFAGANHRLVRYRSKTTLGSPDEIEDVFAKCSSKVPEVPTKVCICTRIENLLVQL